MGDDLPRRLGSRLWCGECPDGRRARNASFDHLTNEQVAARRDRLQHSYETASATRLPPGDWAAKLQRQDLRRAVEVLDDVLLERGDTA